MSILQFISITRSGSRPTPRLISVWVHAMSLSIPSRVVLGPGTECVSSRLATQSNRRSRTLRTSCSSGLTFLSARRSGTTRGAIGLVWPSAAYFANTTSPDPGAVFRSRPPNVQIYTTLTIMASPSIERVVHATGTNDDFELPALHSIKLLYGTPPFGMPRPSNYSHVLTDVHTFRTAVPSSVIHFPPAPIRGA
jgi:hypothetical protein